MNSQRYYLRPNLLPEPLVNHWVAYDQLVFPPSAAMVVKNSQLQIIKSYIADPTYHMQACREPGLVGGPWMNFATNRVEQITALLKSTEQRAAALIELSAAIKTLDELLRKEGRGGSLEPLYARVPEALKGYVELVYDLNCQPSIRFLEGLLYRSRFYDRSLQSFSLSLIEKDNRPFQWSTPTLEEEHRLIAPLPFDHPNVDRLFSTRAEPRALGEIQELLGVSSQQTALLQTFLTEERPPARHQRVSEGVRVRYFGHACVLVETREVSVLVDPFISYEYPTTLPRFTHQDLPEKIDFVLLTHAHNDHTELETLLQLRHKIGTVVVPRTSGGKLQDPSLRLLLQTLGFKSVVELHELESVPCEGGQIVALPFLGEHCDLDIQSKRGFLVQLLGKSVLFAADSCNLEPRMYWHIKEVVGSLDVLFLGMECEGAPLSWGYGKLLTQPMERKADQSRTFSGSDSAQAMAIVDALEPKEIYIYAMGEEPWVDHVMVIPEDPTSKRVTEPERFIHQARQRGLTAQKLFGSKELSLR